MTLVMYERVGHEGRRPSPFSWRIRYRLAHKEIAVEYRPTRFADVEKIKELSSQRYVPIIVDGTTVVSDSWKIATYLEDHYGGGPTLFGGPAGRASARFVNIWSDTVLSPPLRRLIYGDFIWCLAPEDRAYFRQSREKDLGQTLEEACLDRGRWQAEFEAACLPLERLLAEQAFIAGRSPLYADYIVFSVFQWAHLGCPRDVVPAGTALAGWRSRMRDLFNGLANAFPGYPEEPNKH
jgi:glutathione S-transferase